MAKSLGKKFEDKVKEDWERTFPTSFLYRLQDQQSKYFGQSSNVSDYIGFVNKKLFLIECKETKETTFNWAKLRQYDDLLAQDDKDDTYPGVILWFSAFDKVVWLNICEIKQMKEDGLKSFNIKMIDNCDYNVYTIPATKLRTFMRCDLSIFRDIEK